MQPQAAGFAQQYGMTYSPYPPPSTTSYTPYPAPMPSPYIPGPYQSPYTPLAQAGRGPVGSRSGSGVMSSTGRRERQGNNRGKGAAEGGLAPRSSGVQKAPRKEGNTIRRAQKPEPKREVGIALGVAPLARGSSSRARGHDASQGATVDAQAVSQDVDADGDVKMEDDDDAMGEEQDLDSDGDVRMRDA
ncbi:uncharacterized protein KY384_004631 [Bacidia gigantensis]|uniref:uncharacterized protein n=1 Tax=Bacidia gigantensis TaxID=2732470 RepID=UPI001D0472D4|nr:uncharacterized protein KY384_004631 [Bacidia gigantensis]KAG8531273.1 hypothetical protein KY384_004631 [Bacidia gigantensis]